MGDLEVPENISAIQTPSLNKEIWSILDKSSRSLELRNMQLQDNLQRVAVTAAKSLAAFLEIEKEARSRTPGNTGNEKISKLMTENLNAISLLGMASSHISYMRRQRLKPQISEKISGICDLPFDGKQSFLFGDDINASISMAEQKRKVTESVARGPKPQPQKTQDFRKSFQKKKPPFQQNKPKNRYWGRAKKAKGNNNNNNSTSSNKKQKLD